ncbi:MAG TPA: hypothetical protein VJ349_07285 [Stellaceae bacterium]|nr:hypothetical protein [Stellaceae bacterium]
MTAGECDGDVPHRRIGLRAMPMAFTCLDVHDVTDIDFAPFMLGGTMPAPEVTINTWSQLWVCHPRGAALAEVHNAAVIVGRVPRLNDRLARPGNRACVAFDRLGTFHWDLGYIFERDHLHDDSLLCLSGIEDISKPEIASRDLHLSRLWRPLVK